jgi:hypothetical protein
MIAKFLSPGRLSGFPYSEPGEQLIPVATPKHPVRLCRGFEFGLTPMLVHHQVRGKEYTFQGIVAEEATRAKHRPA